jgi:hypothetical protein
MRSNQNLKANLLFLLLVLQELLIRMLSPKGNPTMDNLTSIFKVLRQKLNVEIKVHTVPV